MGVWKTRGGTRGGIRPVRAKAVAEARAKKLGPMAPRAGAGDRQLARMSGAELVAEIERRTNVAIGNNYAMARCLWQLTQPARYQALGFKSFEALLKGHQRLPTRVTAHKWFTVLAHFDEAE